VSDHRSSCFCYKYDAGCRRITQKNPNLALIRLAFHSSTLCHRRSSSAALRNAETETFIGGTIKSRFREFAMRQSRRSPVSIARDSHCRRPVVGPAERPSEPLARARIALDLRAWRYNAPRTENREPAVLRNNLKRRTRGEGKLASAVRVSRLVSSTPTRHSGAIPSSTAANRKTIRCPFHEAEMARTIVSSGHHGASHVSGVIIR
jgi:hypothetical protein